MSAPAGRRVDSLNAYFDELALGDRFVLARAR